MVARTRPLAEIDDNGSVRARVYQDTTYTPNPDPTLLTTQQLFREITNLKDQIETRLDGYDKAIGLLQNKADKEPGIPEIVAEFREKLKGVIGLFDEKFRGVQTQFTERDERVAQTSKGGKEALDAALQAAKEAVGEQQKANAQAISKSEAATTKQLDQISAQITSQAKGYDDKIDDLKGRLTSFEGKTSVSDPAVSNGINQLTTLVTDLAKSRDNTAGAKEGQASMVGYVVTIGGLVLALIGVIVAFISRVP